MSNRAALFSEVDLKRALRAAVKAGFAVKSVEITRSGTIRLLQSTEQREPAVDDEEPVVL